MNKSSLPKWLSILIGPILICAGAHAALSGPGTAIALDGSSGYVSTASSAGSPQNFTLSLWFNTTSTNGGRLIGMGDSRTGLSANYDRQIYMDNSGVLHFGVAIPALTVISSPNTYNNGLWHYVTATLSSTNGITLFVDGTCVASNAAATSAFTYPGPSWWRIGWDNLTLWPYAPASDFFQGQLDEVQIWSTPLTAAQVSNTWHQIRAGTETGLASYWRFDDGSGLSASDSTGAGNTGTLMGGASWVASAAAIGAPGLGAATASVFDGAVTFGGSVSPNCQQTASYFQFGLTTNYGSSAATNYVGGLETALQFDGATGNIDVPGFGATAPTNGVTIEFWANVRKVTTQSEFILDPDEATNRINAHIPWSDGKIYWDYGNIAAGGRASYLPPGAVTGSWQHFALVASPGSRQMLIYRNGILEESNAYTSSFANFPAALLIGGGATAADFFGGSMTEFRVWDAVIDQTTIQEWMRSSLTPAHPYYNSLNAYWPLHDGAGTHAILKGGSGQNGVLAGGVQWSGGPVFATDFWSNTIAGLTHGATYHFRAVAVNSGGATYGADQTFTMPTGNLADSGPGTLRQAILNAQASNLVVIDASQYLGVIQLVTPLPTITNNLTIDGPTNGSLVISGGGVLRPFFINVPGGIVNLNHLTISNGSAQGATGGPGGGGGAGLGGGIFVNAGSLVLSNVTFANNKAVGGAGGSNANDAAGGGGGGMGGAGGTGYYAGGGGGGLTSAGSDGGVSTGAPGGGPDGGAGGLYGNPASPAETGGNGDAVAGGGGGGGATSGYNNLVGGNGGDGGLGGGGGGGGFPGGFGGNGGFGGGAGSGSYSISGQVSSGNGGFGGFGGGGGGGASGFNYGSQGFGGSGGFAAGAGQNGLPYEYGPGPGGGGAGIGGAVFLRAEARSTNFLELVDVSFGPNLVAGGSGGNPGQGLGSALFLDGGHTILTVSSGTNVIGGTVAGWSAQPATVFKTGLGTLDLGANFNSPGLLEISAGTVLLASALSASQLTVSSGASMGISGGVSSLAANNLVWSGAGNFNWRLYDATGDPGVGYDSITLAEQLDFSQASNFNLNLSTLSDPFGATNGNAIHLNASRSWTLVQAAGGILGSVSNLNVVVTSGFSNPLHGGVFSLSVESNSLILTYTLPEPSVATLPAAVAPPGSATINGSVNPNGLATSVYFQYGPTVSYGSVSPATLIAVGTNAVGFSENLSNLANGLTYHCQAVAVCDNGTNYGGDIAFTLPAVAPMILGSSVSPTGNAGAQVMAAVNPGGEVSAVYVAYGTSTNYGSYSPTNYVGGLNIALLFDGISGDVRVPNFAQLAPTTEVTIEFWQYNASQEPAETFILIPDNPNDRINANSPWSDGNVYWDFGDIDGAGRLSYAPPVALQNSWQHFAFVASQSGNYMRIYRNGQLEASRTGMSPFIHDFAPLYIGGASGNYFGGLLTEFRVWNAALDQATIQSWMNAALTPAHPDYARLDGYWPMKDGAGGIVTDASANADNGTIQGGVAWATGPQATQAQASVNLPLSNLSPNIVYHFQVLAINSAGTNVSPDMTVLVPAPPTAIAGALTNGAFRFLGAGAPDFGYTIQASTNLQQWVDLGQVTAGSNGLFQFTDASATNYPARFYRIRQP